VIGADHPYRKPIQIDALQGAEVGCPFRVKLGNTRNEQIFSALPPITDILGDRLARLSSGGRGVFIPYPTRRAPCPRLSRLTRFYDLLAGWKLESFLLIRYRPRYPVCVWTAALPPEEDVDWRSVLTESRHQRDDAGDWLWQSKW